MQLTTLVISLAAIALVSACDERPAAPRADASASVTAPSAGSAPIPTPAPASATSAPTGVPPASSVTGGAVDAATARDAKSNNPTGTLTKEEESSSMPKAGQANNHSSPALEKAKP